QTRSRNTHDRSLGIDCRDQFLSDTKIQVPGGQTHQGGGTGRRLLDLTLDWLRQEGRSTVWIGVWSENFGAQRLYGRLGFEKVGEYGFPVGKTLDREFILRRCETPTR
ncbi:MAG: GNAT family N-acetyltransferase, partial [Caulobacteraceae bacterium]|nr:GNAT family N-acetyltransferase [Caulobacteraceae bacterium]